MLGHVAAVCPSCQSDLLNRPSLKGPLVVVQEVGNIFVMEEGQPECVDFCGAVGDPIINNPDHRAGMGQVGHGEQGAAEIWEFLRGSIELLVVFLCFKPASHSGIAEDGLGPTGPIIRTFLKRLRPVVELVDEAAFWIERLDGRVALCEALLDGRSRAVDQVADQVRAGAGRHRMGS